MLHIEFVMFPLLTTRWQHITLRAENKKTESQKWCLRIRSNELQYEWILVILFLFKRITVYILHPVSKCSSNTTPSTTNDLYIKEKEMNFKANLRVHFTWSFSENTLPGTVGLRNLICFGFCAFWDPFLLTTGVKLPVCCFSFELRSATHWVFFCTIQ